MNLIGGKLMEDDGAKAALALLDNRILGTKAKGGLDAGVVIRACNAVSNAINEENHLHLLTGLGMKKEKARAALTQVKQMLSAGYLQERLRRELNLADMEFVPFGLNCSVRQKLAPLGALFHIAAGNVDALPAMSVLEGLLTGNINILKLPSQDDGLSLAILGMLIAAAPELAEYIYVFGFPSSDIDSMKVMAQYADAIVVWGGDEAVKSVRSFAAPNIKLIEWGHKLSFAYVSGNAKDEELEGIAYNICDTNQLFCNSCQGVFLDADSFDEAEAFAERFSFILEKAAGSAEDDIFITAQKKLEIYTEQLEAKPGRKRVFQRGHCSVTAYNDTLLEPSHMYRNCWVRPLPKHALLRELAKYKGHLQTVALICGGDRDSIENILVSAGAVRITSGQNMSHVYCGMPHDGEFSLMRYVKVVSREF